MINMRIDKDEIRKGLRDGYYTKIHKHKNPYPEADDPDDKSYEEHTTLVYINQSYNVAGVKTFFGNSPEFGENVRIPIVLHNNIEKDFLFGLRGEDYKVLDICDGFNTMEQISEITQIPLEKLENIIESLKQKKLIQVIKRN